MELDKMYDIIRSSKPALKFCEWFDEDSTMWNFTRHSHPYHEFIYYIEGKGDVDVSGTNVAFSLYDTVVYPAHHEHQDKRIPERRREIICLWLDVPGLVLEEPIRLHESDSTLFNAFQMVYREGKRDEPDELILEYAMKLLMLLVLRGQWEKEKNGEGEGKFLDCALEYIKNHYAEKITLDDLAGLEHISKSYLSRKFKQRTGYSVISYINRTRIERSKQFLMASVLDVNEIAYQVGFDSPKYFHRVFKELVGESPASFRRKFKLS